MTDKEVKAPKKVNPLDERLDHELNDNTKKPPEKQMQSVILIHVLLLRLGKKYSQKTTRELEESRRNAVAIFPPRSHTLCAFRKHTSAYLRN